MWISSRDWHPCRAGLAPGFLTGGTQLSLVSEKSRSEFIVAPILLACRELSGDAIAIYSGQNLNVDPAKGLHGECDFILARVAALAGTARSLITIVEAKRNDIELGLGQCAAQMVGARQFNEHRGRVGGSVFGCVTTGEVWQFLKLEASQLGLDRLRCNIDKLGTILAVIQAMIASSAP